MTINGARGDLLKGAVVVGLDFVVVVTLEAGSGRRWGTGEEEGRKVAERPHHHPLPRRRSPWRNNCGGLHPPRRTAAPAHRLPHPHALQIERLCCCSEAKPPQFVASVPPESATSRPNRGRKSRYLCRGSGWKRGCVDREEDGGSARGATGAARRSQWSRKGRGRQENPREAWLCRPRRRPDRRAARVWRWRECRRGLPASSGKLRWRVVRGRWGWGSRRAEARQGAASGGGMVLGRKKEEREGNEENASGASEMMRWVRCALTRLCLYLQLQGWMHRASRGGETFGRCRSVSAAGWSADAATRYLHWHPCMRIDPRRPSIFVHQSRLIISNTAALQHGMHDTLRIFLSSLVLSTHGSIKHARTYLTKPYTSHIVWSISYQESNYTILVL
jgi:hypothetical protein